MPGALYATVPSFDWVSSEWSAYDAEPWHLAPPSPSSEHDAPKRATDTDAHEEDEPVWVEITNAIHVRVQYVGTRIRKQYFPRDPRALEDCEREVEVRRMLGNHARIVECVAFGQTPRALQLRDYGNGNLKHFASGHNRTITHAMCRRWARQMAEGVVFLHRKDVLHADLRLDQWMVDHEFNARLGGFECAAHLEQPSLQLGRKGALCVEIASHCMPRAPGFNSIQTDLFALGSSLYELVLGKSPFLGLPDEDIEDMFRARRFPNTRGILLGHIMRGCWDKRYDTADEVVFEMNEDEEDVRRHMQRAGRRSTTHG